jgi:hypothetical protein
MHGFERSEVDYGQKPHDQNHKNDDGRQHGPEKPSPILPRSFETHDACGIDNSLTVQPTIESDRSRSEVCRGQQREYDAEDVHRFAACAAPGAGG